MVITLLKKYWLKTLISIVVVILTSVLSSWVTKSIYQKQIKALDANISEAWEKIGDSKIREEKWKASAEKNWDLAMKKESLLRRRDKEMRVKIAEKRALKKTIRELPVTQVIVRTIEIINCPDVVQQTKGIVFTLDCAKDNLAVLENVFYFKKEALDWADQFFTSQAEVADLKNVIIDNNKAYAERGKQIKINEEEIIKSWTNKFNLSEKRGKSNWWRGLKTGGIIGGIVGGVIVFVLRR